MCQKCLRNASKEKSDDEKQSSHFDPSAREDVALIQKPYNYSRGSVNCTIEDLENAIEDEEPFEPNFLESLESLPQRKQPNRSCRESNDG